MSNWLHIILVLTLLSLPNQNGVHAAPTEETSNLMDMIDIASKMISMQNPQMGHMIRKVRNTVENVDLEELRSNCQTMDMLIQCISALKTPISQLYEAGQLLQDMF